MEVSQRPGQAEDSPGHRWAGILGTAVAVITLTLPIAMIASYSPADSITPSEPTTIYQPNRPQNIKAYPME